MKQIFNYLFRSKEERELDNQQTELYSILNENTYGTQARGEKLSKFALEIGANILDEDSNTEVKEAKLLHNIHTVLQMKAMIAAVKATSNYVIVSIVLALIAFLSLVATFIIAFK